MPPAGSALELRRFGDPADSVVLVNSPGRPRLTGTEVLVELEAAAINPSDLRLISGRYGVRPPLPAPLGSEGVGRVVRVGPTADPGLVGRRAVILPGRDHGTWATRMVLDRSGIVPVRDDTDPLQLAMAGVNPATALLLLRSGGSIAAGTWVAQTGANSAVGQYVVRLARRLGIKTFNVVRRPDAAQVVLDAGGDVVVSDSEVAARLAGAEAGLEFALVLDSVAGPVVTELVHRLGHGGRVVSYGAISGQPVALAVREDLIYRDISHHGFWILNWLRRAAPAEIDSVYGEVVDLVAAGELTATVERTYRLTDHREALARAAEYRRSGKILFRFGDGGAGGGPGLGGSESAPPMRSGL